MEFLYKTIKEYVRDEIVIEKSRFIATAIPCNSKEEADEFFDDIKREFKDATHNVPAFIVGNKMELKWASDDGEPQGTAGPPILRFLEAKGITNVAVCVTRYFGGIKLGTGGLVRAYTESVESVVREENIAMALPIASAKITMEYPEYNRVSSYRFPEEIKETLEIKNVEFGEKVVANLSCHRDVYEETVKVLEGICNGRIEFSQPVESIGLVSLTTST